MPIGYTPDYEGCFVCGMKNPKGMKLRFCHDAERDEMYTVCRFPEYMQGFESIVHGGFISMLLDEVMAKACLQRELAAVTAKMEIRFKKPVLVDEEMTVRGRVVDIKGKKIRTEARCMDRSGVERVSALALFVLP